MKYFKHWNLSKSFMLSFFIFLTLAIYFWKLPTRETMWFGGEIFLLTMPFFINYIPEMWQLFKEVEEVFCELLNEVF